MKQRGNLINVKSARCYYNPKIVCEQPFITKRINRHRKRLGLNSVGSIKCKRCEHYFGMDKFINVECDNMDGDR